MFKMSTIHANTCIQTTTPLRNRWWYRWQCQVLHSLWVERTLKVERTTAEGVEAAGPLFVSSILVSVNVIDINMYKVLILCEMCYFFVSETFTRYSSNITNVWQEIFTPVTLAFSCEVVHEKLWKSVNISKSYSKKWVAPFFWTRCI